MGLLDQWNKNKFSIYKSEEKTVLKLLESLGKWTEQLIKEVDNKTDLYGDHKGTWQGLSKPTLSEEGLRATVENHISDISNLQNKNISLSNDLTKLKGRFTNSEISFIGDSILFGHVDKPFATIVGEKLNSKINNLGVDGSAITVVSGRSDSVYERRTSIPISSKLIGVFAGTNDFGHNSPMGNNFTLSINNFYGALVNFIEYVLSNYPNAQLFFITPLHREGEYIPNSEVYVLEDYVEVIKDVCNHYGIPYLDLYNTSGLNPNVASQKTLYFPDGLHINQEGHNIIGEKITSFIRGL